ncbi:unnamed protein product [Fraxinus pennsylvanica]|uniref:DUF8041 domain-containing protein n=1 Tax=Fraxinus pennsylvanica TaxID=56036 RepID=A0AAD2DNE7_9LAMI|nr:unnamed protein product [Fraxinus pennsylvanica]
MENIYMWVFKEKPENALGKMQPQSYMNGHSRQGDRPFPFSVDKGFVQSHRMQHKHCRGLSNPQCIHGIEVVPSPNLTDLDEDDCRRWAELTGRDSNFTIPLEARRSKSLEGVCTVLQQECQPGEALVEWRSSEQLENRIPSTSPPYWDSSDDDDGMSFVPFRILGIHVNEFLLLVLF